MSMDVTYPKMKTFITAIGNDQRYYNEVQTKFKTNLRYKRL